MAGNTWRHTTSAFLIGVGVGAGLGVLFAPKSGERTRDDIANAVVDNVIAQGKRLRRRAQSTFDHAKTQIRDVAEHLPGRA